MLHHDVDEVPMTGNGDLAALFIIMGPLLLPHRSSLLMVTLTRSPLPTPRAEAAWPTLMPMPGPEVPTMGASKVTDVSSLGSSPSNSRWSIMYLAIVTETGGSSGSMKSGTVHPSPRGRMTCPLCDA